MKILKQYYVVNIIDEKINKYHVKFKKILDTNKQLLITSILRTNQKRSYK